MWIRAASEFGKVDDTMDFEGLLDLGVLSAQQGAWLVALYEQTGPDEDQEPLALGVYQIKEAGGRPLPVLQGGRFYQTELCLLDDQDRLAGALADALRVLEASGPLAIGEVAWVA